MNLSDPRYFFAFFLFIWVAVGLLVGQIGGWSELSRYYRAINPFEGKRWRFKSGRMRFATGYNNILTLGVDSQGLYLAVPFFFRLGHPPLFIPWQDIAVKRGKSLFWKWVEFHFRQTPGVYLRIFGKLGEEMKTAAGQFWPAENVPEQNQF